MKIGERMLRYRARNRITQKELGVLMGVPQHTIFRCENEKHTPTKANFIYLDAKLKELEEKENAL